MWPANRSPRTDREEVMNVALDFDLLRRLSEAPGVASREERVREVAVAALRPLVDEVRFDALGNAIGLKRAEGRPRVLIAAHLDEIGFLVRFIDPRGFLKLQHVGGFDARTLFAQRVLVHGSNGSVQPGVLMPGVKPTHLLAGEEPKAPKLDDFFVDLGLPVDQVRETVEVGDMVTLERAVERIGSNVVGKAMDDRIGVYVMLEAMRRLQSHRADVFAVATVQEEVGLRGATTAGFGIEPDVAIALDVTLAVDIPGVGEADVVSRLGQGAAIKIMDSSLISDHRLVRHFRDLAHQHGIPYQLEILPRGGTDAGGIQRVRAGVPAITLSIPARYVHTVNEMVAESDVEACANLLARYLEVAHTYDYAFTA
jgi:putative aminopeptidase FrvX